MKHYRTILIVFVFAVLFMLSVSSVSAAPSPDIADGQIIGQCLGWPKPHIELRWSEHQPAGALLPNANGMLRSVDDGPNAWFFGGAYPGVSGTRIDGSSAPAFGPSGFPNPNIDVHDLRDVGIASGHTYTYEVKYRPETTSVNTYAVMVNAANCGGNPDAPTVALNVGPLEGVGTSGRTLSWDSTNALSCVAYGAWSGMKPTSGTQTVADILTNGSFGLNCSNQMGQAATITRAVLLADAPPPPAGTIAGTCTWNQISNAPQVNLVWSSDPPPGQGAASGNSLQKGDVFPNDPTQYWGFLSNDPAQHVYTDTNVQLNTNYQYRVKYRPDLPSSNGYSIYISNGTCGGPASAPGPLTLSPNFQTVPPAVTTYVSATGGDGNTYVWEAPTGKILGSGSTIGLLFTNDSTQSILKTVTVHSGGQTTSVTVQVNGIQTFTDDINLTEPSDRFVRINDDAPTTLDSNVTLTFSHGLTPDNDAGVTMRIANTMAGLASAPLQPYTKQLSWNLCDGLPTCEEGPLTVYVIYRSPQGADFPMVMDNILYQKGSSDIPLVLINGGSPTTLDRNVTLTLKHGFPAGVRDDEVTMQIANTLADVDGAPVSFYTLSVLDWDLCSPAKTCANGIQTVYVQYCARGVCQLIVHDDIMYGVLPCVPRPVCTGGPKSACANPGEEPEGGWCPVPTPGPGILIDDGRAVTRDRLVDLTLHTPFNGTLGESMRIINANELSQRDRDVIAQRGGGIPNQVGLQQGLPLTGVLVEDQIPELESGKLTNFTSSLNGWDLCSGGSADVATRTCPYGTYTVYVQYYGIGLQITPPPNATLTGLNDQVSDIYYDTIEYAAPTPTPSPTPTPTPSESPSPTVTGEPTTTPGGGPVFGPVGKIIAGAAGLINSISIISAVAVTASAIAALIPLLGSGVGVFVYQWFMGVLGLLPGRKQTWGTVYDANTKRPIPFVKVQLLDRNRRVLETHISDKDGRYGFLTTPESLMAQNLQISILPSHEGYAFPSHTPASIDTFIYNNLYYGSVIQVNDKTLINFDIPMDPLVASRMPLFLKSPSIAAGAAVAAVADAGFWLGLIMVPLNFALSPSPFTFGVLCLFLGTASLRLFGISEHPYGAVMDATTGRPMSFALITLNDMTGKRAGFAVSDERGRYFLVVEKGTYEMTVFTPAAIVPPRRSVQTVTAKKGWITREIKV